MGVEISVKRVLRWVHLNLRHKDSFGLSESVETPPFTQNQQFLTA
jgi:hypothetical protein